MKQRLPHLMMTREPETVTLADDPTEASPACPTCCSRNTAWVDVVSQLTGCTVAADRLFCLDCECLQAEEEAADA